MTGTDTPRGLAFNWAELCGFWALTAYKLKRYSQAEHAILIQCRILKALGAKEAHMEALKALMLARRHQRNETGVEEALEALGDLAPPEQREAILYDMRCMLLKVGPPIQPHTKDMETKEDAGVSEWKQKVKKRRLQILGWFGALS